MSFDESLEDTPLEHDVETAVIDYYLVLSNFRQADRAHSFADQVNSREAQPVEVSTTEVDNEKLYRVVHGSFNHRVKRPDLRHLMHTGIRKRPHEILHR